MSTSLITLLISLALAIQGGATGANAELAGERPASPDASGSYEDETCYALPRIRWDGPTPIWVLNCQKGCETCSWVGDGQVLWCDCDPNNTTPPECCTSGINDAQTGPVAIGGCQEGCPTEQGACVVLPSATTADCITGPP